MKSFFVRAAFRCLLIGLLTILAPARSAEPAPTAAPESAQFHNARALAEARIGRWSRALAELRLAERCAPYNADVQENLRLVRTKLEQPAAPNPLRSLGRLPVNLWAAATLLGSWLVLVFAGLRQWRADWRPRLALPLALALGLGISGAALLGLTLLGRRWTPNAVIIAKDAILRQGPVDAAKPIGTIADGAEIRIRREHRGWYEIGPVRPGTPALGWLPPGPLIVVSP